MTDIDGSVRYPHATNEEVTSNDQHLGLGRNRRLILAIDPGNTESAYALIQADGHQPVEFDKIDNHTLLAHLREQAGFLRADHVVIEMVESYGMAVGKEVFETCVWIGRFLEALKGDAELIYRGKVKMHHCLSRAAKDPNIIQALVDRYAPGSPNRGKGTKAQPGWFYGFAADVWQAYALGVYAADVVYPAQPRDTVPQRNDPTK